MNVAIVGSRDYPRLGDVGRFVERLAAKYPHAVVISGDARGVDREAELEAKARGLAVLSYRPEEFEAMDGRRLYTIETVTLGEAAQTIAVAKHRRINPPCFSSYAATAKHRNGWIVEDADQVVAFWDGASSGTADTIRRARAAGVPVHGRDTQPRAQVYVYAWGNNSRRAELKGRRCIVEVRGGRLRTVLVRFLDTGERVTTSARALREVPA